MSPPPLAFVSAPGGSLFIEELLSSVADAVRRAGGDAWHERRWLADARRRDPSAVAVIVPHEYVALDTEVDGDLLGRTIGFGVEHPGTATFETSAAVMARLGGAVEIGADSVIEMAARGVSSRRFVLGYSPAWDERERTPPAERDIDIVHLGTADERRLRELAPMVAPWAGRPTELVLAPHEPMTGPRPDFVIGEAKRDLLGRSRLLVNLHREGATAFEWVRALDAIRAGCVVLTTPSRGLAPLVPGEHVLVADPARLGRVALAALADPELLGLLADAAYERCRVELDMVASAAQLLDLADAVATAASRDRRGRPATPSAPSVDARPVPPPEPPMAVWVPAARALPQPAAPADRSAKRLVYQLLDARAGLDRRPVVSSSTGDASATVDVICVSRPGDGPVSLTVESLASSGVPLAVHVAADDGPTPVGRGAARNHLLSSGSAPLVLVLDAGDEVLESALADLVGRLGEGDDLDLVYPMAVLGSSMVVNALIPERRRLARHSYLDRGYLVRRSFLDGLGRFAERPELEGFVDHDFWCRAVDAGVRAELRRHVGLRLWEQQPDLTIADVDPVATLGALP